MSSFWRSAVALTCVLGVAVSLTSCGSTAIFYADFEQDVVGQPPASNPPGIPAPSTTDPDDLFEFERDTPLVVADAGEQSLRVDGQGVGTRILLDPEGGPYRRADTEMWFQMNGVAREMSSQPVTLTIEAQSGAKVASIHLVDGDIVFEDGPTIEDAYEVDVPHYLVWVVHRQDNKHRVKIRNLVDRTEKEAGPVYLPGMSKTSIKLWNLARYGITTGADPGGGSPTTVYDIQKILVTDG